VHCSAWSQLGCNVRAQAGCASAWIAGNSSRSNAVPAVPMLYPPPLLHTTAWLPRPERGAISNYAMVWSGLVVRPSAAAARQFPKLVAQLAARHLSNLFTRANQRRAPSPLGIRCEQKP